MTNVEPQPKKRTILGEDGELREEIDLPLPNQASIFCTQCGSSNPSDANFCWKCGKSLSAAVAGSATSQSQPKRKVKNEELDEDENEPAGVEDREMDWREMRDAARRAKDEWKLARRAGRRQSREEFFRAPMEGMYAGGLNAALSLFTLFFVAGMTISAITIHGGDNGWLAIPILVSWFLVEGARRALRRAMSVPAFIVEFFTLIFVSGMVTTSMTVAGGSNSWVSIIVLVMWLLVEGARGALGRTFTAIGAITDIGTMVLVSGIVATAVTLNGGSNGWLSVPILVGWLLVESARKALGHEEGSA